MRIVEIAKQASVSPATVSRAINQPEIVAPESLKRIRAVMKKHDYTPTPLSQRRGPKARKSNSLLIGVWFVGADPDTPSLNWFQQRIGEFQEQITRKHIKLQMLLSGSVNELPREITRERLDGLIILGQEPGPKVMSQLGQWPCVWFMSRRSKDYPGDFVEPNNEENGGMAADFLVRQGHKNVAVLATDSRDHATLWRIRAFMQRAKAHGLEAHSIIGNHDPGSDYPEIPPLKGECEGMVRRLTELNPCPTGLYIPVDHFAEELIRELQRTSTISGQTFEFILGNYDPQFVHQLRYRPAALDINLSTLINKAIDHLVWRIENPNSTGRIGIKIAPTLRPALE